MGRHEKESELPGSGDRTTGLPRLLTAHELASDLGLTLPRTYAMARKGLIPAVWLGRQLRFDPNAIREWLAKGGSPLRTQVALPTQRPVHR